MASTERLGRTSVTWLLPPGKAFADNDIVPIVDGVWDGNTDADIDLPAEIADAVSYCFLPGGCRALLFAAARTRACARAWAGDCGTPICCCRHSCRLCVLDASALTGTTALQRTLGLDRLRSRKRKGECASAGAVPAQNIRNSANSIKPSPLAGQRLISCCNLMGAT